MYCFQRQPERPHPIHAGVTPESKTTYLISSIAYFSQSGKSLQYSRCAKVVPITYSMNTIMPSQQGDECAPTADALQVLARIPYISAAEVPVPGAGEIAPEFIDGDTFEEQEQVAEPDNKLAIERSLERRPEKSRNELESEKAKAQRSKSRIRSSSDRTKRPADQRNRFLPPTNYVMAGAIALLLVVIAILLTRQDGSDANNQPSPDWPGYPTEDIADTKATVKTQPSDAFDGNTPSGPGKVAEHDRAGSGHPLPPWQDGVQPPPSLSPSTLSSSTSNLPQGDIPGEVRLNGTIGKTELHAQQPQSTGVYSTLR